MNANLEQATDLTIHIGKRSYRDIRLAVSLRPHGRRIDRLKMSALSSELSSGSNGEMFPWTDRFLVDNDYGYWYKTFILTFGSDSERFALQKSLVEEFATEWAHRFEHAPTSCKTSQFPSIWIQALSYFSRRCVLRSSIIHLKLVLFFRLYATRT